MLTRRRPVDDAGQLTLLIIGFTALATLLILVGVDVSKVFLARRALSSAADAAALAAAQSVNVNFNWDRPNNLRIDYPSFARRDGHVPCVSSSGVYKALLGRVRGLGAVGIPLRRPKLSYVSLVKRPGNLT